MAEWPTSLFAGSPPPQGGSFAIPGFDGPLGMLASLGLDRAADGLAARHGYAFAGFDGSAPMPDVIEARRYRQALQAAQAQATGAEKARVADILEGLHLLSSDKPWTPEAQQWADSIGNVYGMALPFIAAADPRIARAVAGAQGSPVVAAAQHALAGRNAIDPLTGARGLSADALTATIRETHELLFPGGRADLTSGLPHDRVAEMFAEASKRRLGPGSVAAQLGEDLVAEVSAGRVDPDRLSAAGLGRDEIDELSSAAADGPDAARRKLLSFDARRTSEWAKGAANATRALEELFGTDAPLPQLFDALDKLTQHNAGGRSFDDLAQQIRVMGELADTSQLGLGNVTELAAAAAERIDAAGGNRGLGATAAIHGVAFATAFKDLGFGDIPGLDAGRLTVLDTALTAQAATSTGGDQFATLGLLRDDGLIADGTLAAARADAALGGRATFEFGGKTHQTFVSNEAELAAELEAAGVDAETFARVRGSERQLRNYLAARPEIVRAVRESQMAVDLAPMFVGQSASIAAAEARKRGVELSPEAQTAIGEAILERARTEVDPDVMLKTDPSGKAEALAGIVREEYARQGVPLDARDAVAVGRMTLGAFEDVAAERGFKTTGEVFALNDERLLLGTRREEALQRQRADLKEALSPLGRTNALQRVSDTLADVANGRLDPETVSGADLVGRVIGLVPAEEVDARTGPLYEALTEKTKAYFDLYKSSADPKTFEVERAEADALREVLQEIRGLTERIRETEAAGGRTEAAAREAAAAAVERWAGPARADYVRSEPAGADRSVYMPGPAASGPARPDYVRAAETDRPAEAPPGDETSAVDGRTPIVAKIVVPPEGLPIRGKLDMVNGSVVGSFGGTGYTQMT
jgi:hypothetical protein